LNIQHQTQWGLWTWSQNPQNELIANQLALTHHAQASLRWKHRSWSLVGSVHNIFNQTQMGSDAGHQSALGGVAIPGRHARFSMNIHWK
jgi:hypothetical protein